MKLMTLLSHNVFSILRRSRAAVLLGLLVLLLPSGTPLTAIGPGLPNIIVIVLDTVRAASTSLHTPSLKTTPNLSRLAQHGVVFEKAYSTYDSTAPSHFSLFTGLKNGFQSKKDRPDQSIAHHLKKLGYDSMGISANYNVRKEAVRSTRAFRLFFSPVDIYLKKKLPNEYKRMESRARSLIRAFDAPESNFNHNINRCSAPAVNQALGHLIKKVHSPALIFANFMDAHDPYFPPDAFHRSESSLPKNFSSDVRDRALPKWMKSPRKLIKDMGKRKQFLRRLRAVSNRAWSLTDDLSKDALSIYEKRYQEEVAYLDSQIEETLSILDTHGFLENSLLIITADHGESFGEKGYITHAMANRGDKETSRHVPMVMVPNYAPLKRKKRIIDTVSIADITPTIYGFLGVDDTPFVEIHGDNYGTSHARHLPKVRRSRIKHQTLLDTQSPTLDHAADQEEMLKSLKALGYIVE